MRRLVGELSNRTGVSRDTIRFYEKESLIAPEKPGRGILVSDTYKNYPEATVATLLFIQRPKILGFTLAEIRGMLDSAVAARTASGTRPAKAGPEPEAGSCCS